jgi:hypothetical protein
LNLPTGIRVIYQANPDQWALASYLHQAKKQSAYHSKACVANFSGQVNLLSVQSDFIFMVEALTKGHQCICKSMASGSMQLT